MGVVNKHTRLKALERQELLHKVHCMYCENRNPKSSPVACDGCAIYDQLLNIGKVLNGTVRERVEEEAV